MTGTAIFGSSMLLLVALGWGTVLRAADEPVPPPGRPTREEIRERFKNLTPEERTARLEAWRDKGGPGAPLADAVLKRRAELQKLREEIKDLPPEQRQARIREWRGTNSFGRPALATMSPEEREALRKRFEKRVEDHIATLNKKKADGSLTEEETRRLRNMERLLQRLESGPNRLESRPNLPLGLPPPATPAVKPSNPDDSVKSK